jgi:hypothetical protein
MKIFSFDPELDNGADDDLSLEEALEEFYYLTDVDGTFYGIIDSEERCIQFAWISQDKWLVDIPKPPDFINYQKYADYDECIDMIKRVYELKEVVQFAGMKKVNINKETLDEKLGIEKTEANPDNPVRKETESNSPFTIDTEDKNQPYKTYKGKNYTEEEWKIKEEKLYQKYLRKKRK